MLGSTIILHKKKLGSPTKLSLVALMDIFTILVFFLLLNSGDSQTLEDAKFVKLPDSSSEKAPHGDLVLHLGVDELWVDDKKIEDVANIVKDLDKPIVSLAEALGSFSEKLGDLNLHEQENGLPVTIMADKKVPYSVLKSVMATCSGENFRDISLAVNRVVAPVFDPYNAGAQPSSFGKPSTANKKPVNSEAEGSIDDTSLSEQATPADVGGQ